MHLNFFDIVFKKKNKLDSDDEFDMKYSIKHKIESNQI